MKIVSLEWDDSVVAGARWISPDDLVDSSMRCTTVGYLVSENEKSITVAQSISWSGDGEVEELGQPITIPRVALTKPMQQLNTTGQ